MKLLYQKKLQLSNNYREIFMRYGESETLWCYGLLLCGSTKFEIPSALFDLGL